MVIAEYGHHYKELETQKDFIIAEIESEEKQFLTTLEKGLKEFKKMAHRVHYNWDEQKVQERGTIFSGGDMFTLYDTY